MMIYEHWMTQREALCARLRRQTDTDGVAYELRHALLQTEQNALADIQDDALRQQTGVLMNCIKNSVAFVQTPVTAQTWTARRQPQPRRSAHWAMPLTALGILLVYCLLKQQWIGMALVVCVLATGLVALLRDRRESARMLPQDDVRVTSLPDVDRLLAITDGQLRAADRFLNDFAYLNDQLRAGGSEGDAMSIERAADLMQALYECDAAERADAEEAALRLLACMGLRAVEYSEQTARFFGTLPSKNITCTLTPAILSREDGRLIRRGTAAVLMDSTRQGDIA